MKIKNFILNYWPLILALFVAGIIRLYGLLQNPISLYSDEVDIGYQVHTLLTTGRDYQGNFLPLQFHSFSDVRTPLPIYFTALVNLIGVPLDLAIRLTPAIFGILGILATYLFLENLSKKEIFDLKVSHLGLIGSAILALIPWHVTFSRIGFELSMLYFFAIFGFYLYTEYLIMKKNKFLYLSTLFLGLTPMVYSTAKLAVLAYPILLLMLSGDTKVFKSLKQILTALVILFLPLVLLLLSGGAASRFQYISIFTNPTTVPEINLERQSDFGPVSAVGSSPSIFTKIFHNKPLWYSNDLTNNLFDLISTQFLFTQGDPNLRHSPENWGVLYRAIFPLLVIGVYFLIRYQKSRLVLFLGSFLIVAMSASVITRGGGTHASRSYMMILPFVVVSGIGLAYLSSFKKILFYLFSLAVVFESIFFLHSYWTHYRYDSAGFWSYGMKQAIISSEKYPGQPIVISPKNENPLIFYLYYTRFDPSRFQKFVQDNTVYINMSGEHNLEGNRIGDSNLYIATLSDMNNKSENLLPEAVYYFAKLETINSQVRTVGTNSDIITSPSGEPIFYEIHF